MVFRLGCVGIALLCAGIYMLFSSLGDLASIKKGIGDINTMAAADFKKGMFVEGDIQLLYDEFAYEESYDSTFGVKHNERVTSHYYVMPLPGADYGEYMAVEISNTSLADQAAKMVDEFYDMYESGDVPESLTSIHFKGKVVKMDKETEKYFYEWLMYGSDDQDKANYTALTSPYMLQYVDDKHTSSMVPTAAIISLIGAVLTAVMVLLYIKEKKQAKAASENNAYFQNSFAGAAGVDDSLQAQMANSAPKATYNPVGTDFGGGASAQPGTASGFSSGMNDADTSGLGIGIDDKR